MSNQSLWQPTNQPTDQPASQSTVVCNYALSNPKNVNKNFHYQLEPKLFVLSLIDNNYTLVDYKWGQKPKFWKFGQMPKFARAKNQNF